MLPHLHLGDPTLNHFIYIKLFPGRALGVGSPSNLDIFTLRVPFYLTPDWPASSNLANLVIYGVFIIKSRLCNINGYAQQYILVDTTFN